MDKFKTKQFNRLVFFDEFEDNIPNELISKKEEINSFEQEHKWELAKKLANPYEMVYTQEEKFPYPNISLIKPLSRSYFKMVEMLYIIKFFEELPKDIQMIRSAHIAEGPGGFIQAFIDVSEQFRRKIKKINAITLKSEKHYVPGWKKASNYLKKYSNIINISYGKDGTGDIYIKENQEYFISEITNKVHLFTADGGFDFSIDYCKQEKDIFHLLVSSFYIALKILTINGTCIIKLFDTYSISTQLLLSLCGSCFKEYTIYKPLSSRPCNSERYFIGIKFKGINMKVLELLTQIESNIYKDKYPKGEMDEDEFNFINNISKKFEKKQIECINLAKQMANNNDLYKEYYKNHFEKSLEFCKQFKIPTKNH
jgi:23S rRNA U2552 (ribose-2'-O)-methylase RlmE/FtsJ